MTRDEVLSLIRTHLAEELALRAASASWASSTSGVPRVDSSPLDNSPTRGRSIPSTPLA